MAAWPPPDAAPEYEWDATTSSGPLGRGADALFEDLFRRALETEASQDFRSYDDGRSRLRGDVGGYSGVVVVRELVAARGALAALASQRVLAPAIPGLAAALRRRGGDGAAGLGPGCSGGSRYSLRGRCRLQREAQRARHRARRAVAHGAVRGRGPLGADAAAAVVPGDGAGQQVLVRRCRFLEEAKCASVCVNACKVPTQAFFNDDMGGANSGAIRAQFGCNSGAILVTRLSLLRRADAHRTRLHETLECRFKFGVAPLEGGDEENELRAVACFSACPSKGELRGQMTPGQCHTMGERLPAATASRIGPRKSQPGMRAGAKGYFAERDVALGQRNDADVAKFHEKEAHRWDVVYDEDYYARHPGGIELAFYPGDTVEIVGDVDDKGLRGVVTHFEFDDGYESCQTCSTSCPVAVMLE